MDQSGHHVYIIAFLLLFLWLTTADRSPAAEEVAKMRKIVIPHLHVCLSSESGYFETSHRSLLKRIKIVSFNHAIIPSCISFLIIATRGISTRTKAGFGRNFLTVGASLSYAHFDNTPFLKLHNVFVMQHCSLFTNLNVLCTFNMELLFA